MYFLVSQLTTVVFLARKSVKLKNTVYGSNSPGEIRMICDLLASRTLLMKLEHKKVHKLELWEQVQLWSGL